MGEDLIFFCSSLEGLELAGLDLRSTKDFGGSWDLVRELG